MIRVSPRFQRLGQTVYWLVAYSGVWAVLSGGTGWGFGLACVLLATWVSLLLRLQPLYLNVLYLPRFLVFFFSEVAIGAWDVARRALHPRVPITPALVTYSLRCSHPQVRLLLSAMVGLLPGTWASHFDDRLLYLHVLDGRQKWQDSVARMEHHLARLLGGSIA